MNMLKYLLLVSALSISTFSAVQAAVTPAETQVLSATSTTTPYQVADKNSGGGSRSGNSGNDDNDSADDNDNDDNGREDHVDSGRNRPRTLGSSGCDDAGDMAEHAGCQG
jgi:hypothetical protein